MNVALQGQLVLATFPEYDIWVLVATLRATYHIITGQSRRRNISLCAVSTAFNILTELPRHRFKFTMVSIDFDWSWRRLSR